MKLLIYVVQPLAIIAAALKWEAVADTLAALFITGAVALVIYSVRRHWKSNHLSQQP